MRELYVLPPQKVQDLDDGDPTDEEHESGCEIIQRWAVLRERPVRDRVRACEGCPRVVGSFPVSTPLYRTAVRHLALSEVGLAPDRSAYTEREINAIVLVKGEMSRAYREKSRGPDPGKPRKRER